MASAPLIAIAVVAIGVLAWLIGAPLWRARRRAAVMAQPLPTAALSGSYCQMTLPDASVICRPTCGTQRVPPLAMAAVAVASCKGVTSRSPCPMARLISSPGFHNWASASS